MGVEATDGTEWTLPNGDVAGIAVSKLCSGQEARPFVLVEIHEAAHALF